MIAQPNRHFDQRTLQLLLDEELSRDEVDRVEVHLSVCDSCRAELEELAGQPQWWNETVDVLSESTVTKDTATMERNAAVTPRPQQSIDASIDWIRPLLDQADQSDQDLSREGHRPAIGRIDHYIVQDVIGQGGMGVVLRGIDPELGRPVAIKVLSPHLAGVGASRTRFMREAKAAAAIVHPSIVPIYSVVPTARLPYLVMPCIDGGNLQQRIDHEGPLEISEVLRIGLQIAEGLVAAHRHGVIHRDIKPANILVEEGNGRVLISDFGLARALDDASLTQSGMIAGTPQYMSPEQARGEAIDARSDLFSLGSLLYTLATGRPPFRADTPLAVLRKISESKPRPIHQINEQMPAWVDALVGKLMRTDLHQRIPTAQAAVTLLQDAHTHVRNPAVHPLPKSLHQHRSRLVWAIGLAATLAIAIVGAGFGLGAWPRSSGSTTASEAASKGSPIIPPSSIESPIVSKVTNTVDPSQAELTWGNENGLQQLSIIDQMVDDLSQDLNGDDHRVAPVPYTN